VLIGYGDYQLTFAMGGSQSPDAAFLTDTGALTDGRTGTSTSASFTGGTQGTSVYAQLQINVTSVMDPTPIWGVVGISNVQGLPEGTKLVFNSVTQRLSKGPRGELCAWWLTNLTGSPHYVFIYNDVGGVASIAAGQVFSIGEVFVGRVIYLPSLVASNPPVADAFDPTAHNSASGGQDWQLMRKPRRIVSANLGYFSTADAKGGSASSVVSGANPAGVIDIQTLRDFLLTVNVCAVCDTPSAGDGAGTVSNGIRFDQSFMQGNWMVARPRPPVSQIQHSQPPLWSWAVSFMQAT